MLQNMNPLLKKALIVALLSSAGYVFIPAKTFWKIGLHVPYPLEWFSVTAPDGSQLSSQECAGRPILLITWGAYCPWMSQNLEPVKKLTTRLRYADVCVVPVSTDESMKKAWAFAQGNNMERPYFWGYEGLSDMFWWGENVLRVYVFDRRGYLRFHSEKASQDYDAIVDAVADALHEGEKSFSPSPTSPDRARYLEENSRPDPEKTRIAAESKRLFEAGDFDALDAMATNFRKTRARTTDDQWKENFLIDALSFSFYEPGHSDAEYVARIRLLDNWAAARPTSVTARMALAHQWFHYAWFTRGNGRARGVSEANMRLFEDRLEKSRGHLEEVAAMPETTPIVYYTLLGVSTAQSWDQSKIDALMQRALAFEPDYLPYYFNRAIGLLPRWNGSDAQLASFLTASADARKDGRGDELYARTVAWLLDFYEVKERPFSTIFSWPRTQAGFRQLIAAHPDSTFWRSLLAHAAVMAEDRPVAAEMFAALGERFDADAWEDRLTYENSRRWASRPATPGGWPDVVSGLLKRLHGR